jgi:hypothetical protein
MSSGAWRSVGRALARIPKQEADQAREAQPVLYSLELSIRNCRQIRIFRLIHYGFFLVFHYINEQKPSLCVLDVICEYRIEGRVCLTSADLLKDKRQWRGLWIAGPESEFAYIVLKRVCKQAIADKHKKRLHELRNSSLVNAQKIVEVAGRPRPYSRRMRTGVLGRSWAGSARPSYRRAS